MEGRHTVAADGIQGVEGRCGGAGRIGVSVPHEAVARHLHIYARRGVVDGQMERIYQRAASRIPMGV